MKLVEITFYILWKVSEIMHRLLCLIGVHSWTYKAKDTGVYLHTYFNGKLPYPTNYYTGHRKCDDCGKRDFIKLKP